MTNDQDHRLPWFWERLESYFQRAYRMEPLDERPECLLAFNRFEYHGDPVSLSCGETIRNGDPVLELHFRRAALLPLIRQGDPTRMGLGLLRLGDRDMPRLAAALQSDPRLAGVRAVHALTLFHRGIRRYGFEVFPMKEWYLERWFTWWHRVLMARDHADGKARIRMHPEQLVTRHVWVSSKSLIQRYCMPAPKADLD